ncbi:MAG: putative porin [Candidatus Omnitrophota bacterium]
MKRVYVILISAAFLMMITGKALFAGEVDVLVDKLVEKGILSPVEAQIILDETKQEVAKDLAQGKSYALPDWVQRTKLKGDLRLRYQYDDKDLDSVSGRNRERVRFRLGIESKVNGQWKIAAGLASGSSDPRSTNQTLQDTFSSKGINLDYMYAQYTAAPWLSVVGGKMERKPILWEPTDLLWDGDINPEGAALVLSKGMEGIDLFMNTGFFVIDESSSKSKEPWMSYAQPGLKWEIGEDVSLKAAATYYYIDSKGYDIDNSANTNSLSGANHKYNYDSISPAFELGIKKPFGGMVPYSGLFGEYVSAFDPKNDNDGYVAGFKFGDKKVEKKGEWQAKYIYRRLERDAWLDALPDSDAYDGDTNVKGHEIVFEYGLGKNVTLGLDYYFMEPIKTLSGVSDHSLGSSNEQQVLQADVVMKF